MQTNEWCRIELLVLNTNTWNHLTVCKQMSSGLFKMLPTNYSFTNNIYLTYLCMKQVWHLTTYKGGYTIKFNQPNRICLSFSILIALFISLTKRYKLAALVEGDPKASFSIATTPRCKGGRYFILSISPLTLDPYLIMLCAKQGCIRYHFFQSYLRFFRLVCFLILMAYQHL